MSDVAKEIASDIRRWPGLLVVWVALDCDFEHLSWEELQGPSKMALP
jgi:hypothetical protein